MAPKKEKGTKKKKSARPPWMTEEMYELSLNLPKLQEFWSGELKESKGSKGKDGKPLKEVPNITKEQAGLFMWQMLFPNNKAAKEKRTECVKLGVMETSVKVLASGKATDVTPALGIMAALAEGIDQQRQIMLDNKPSPLPHVLHAFDQESASLRATACTLLRVLASKDDSRPRLWRAMRDWNWGPLIGCLQLQDRSQLGGRNAAHDAMLALACLTGAKENDIANGACNALVNYEGLKPLVELLKNRVTHPIAKACTLTVLNAIMRRHPGALSEYVVMDLGALQPIVNLFSHEVVPLINKAHAAACLLRFIMPDSLWKDSSALSGPNRPKTAASSATAAAAALAGSVPGTAPPPPVPSIADTRESAGPGPGSAGGAAGASSAGAAGGAAGGGASRMDGLRQAVNHGIETVGTGGSGGGGGEPAVPDDHLMDDETKAEVASRARLVAEAGALPPLVLLCSGPDGPLPDLEAKAAAAAAAGEQSEGGDAKKKKKKASKKKKKGKLEPGMAEAQTYGSAVIRLISLDEAWRKPVVAAGGLRYLLPLLESKIHAARWNVRQTLINLSMSAELMEVLKLYKVPEYIHGGNIPMKHFERPFPPSGADDGLQKLPAHLQATTQQAQAARATAAAGASAKPPPLKVGR